MLKMPRYGPYMSEACLKLILLLDYPAVTILYCDSLGLMLGTSYVQCQISIVISALKVHVYLPYLVSKKRENVVHDNGLFFLMLKAKAQTSSGSGPCHLVM